MGQLDTSVLVGLTYVSAVANQALDGGSCGCPKLGPVEPLGLSTQSHSPVGGLKFILTVDPASRTVSRTAQALLRPA